MALGSDRAPQACGILRDDGAEPAVGPRFARPFYHSHFFHLKYTSGNTATTTISSSAHG
jgi:hypothetical protein